MAETIHRDCSQLLVTGTGKSYKIASADADAEQGELKIKKMKHLCHLCPMKHLCLQITIAELQLA